MRVEKGGVCVQRGVCGKHRALVCVGVPPPSLCVSLCHECVAVPYSDPPLHHCSLSSVPAKLLPFPAPPPLCSPFTMCSSSQPLQHLGEEALLSGSIKPHTGLFSLLSTLSRDLAAEVDARRTAAARSPLDPRAPGT